MHVVMYMSFVAVIAGSDTGRNAQSDDDIVNRLVMLVADPSQDLNTRVEAARLIGRLGEAAKGAVPRLVEVLQRLQGNELADLQLAIIESLGQLGHAARGALPVIATVANRSVDAQIAARLAINNILSAPDTQNVDTLVRQLVDKDPSQRIRAADALRRLGDKAKSALPALYTQLEDTDDAARNAVIDAILEIQKGEKIENAVVYAIAKDLKSNDASKRLMALYKLGRIGPPAAVVANEVDSLRSDTDNDVRKLATDVLPRILGSRR